MNTNGRGFADPTLGDTRATNPVVVVVAGPRAMDIERMLRAFEELRHALVRLQLAGIRAAESMAAVSGLEIQRLKIERLRERVMEAHLGLDVHAPDLSAGASVPGLRRMLIGTVAAAAPGRADRLAEAHARAQAPRHARAPAHPGVRASKWMLGPVRRV